MNPTQYENWKQFSLGLAKSSYPKITPARREKLMDEVDDCIEYVVYNGLDAVNDWDAAVYRNGQLYEYSAGTRVSDWMWNNRYEREVEDRKGNVEVVCGRFGTMIGCCVRAGFDVAVSPSGGVLGYTVGDIRNIFDGAIPDWVVSFFEPPLPTDACDSDGVWL